MIGGKFGASIGSNRILISSYGIFVDAVTVVAQPNTLLNFRD